MAWASIVVALAGAARAQTILGEWTGTPNAEFGRLVGAAGDVNGDGSADVLVAEHNRVRVFSGETHALLHTFNAPSPSISFAVSAAAGGDVDDDGFADVIVGAPHNDALGTDSGSVWVYSGRTGQVLRLHHGLTSFEHAGTQVGFAGDVDGDGRDDYFASSPDWLFGSGRLRVYSGATGILMTEFTDYTPGERFGALCGQVGDLDGDGVPELAASTGPDAFSGIPPGFQVLSLPTGAVLVAFATDEATSIASAGDVDLDGAPDIVVGQTDVAATGTLYRIHSSATGLSIAVSDSVPFCCVDTTFVASGGDLDGDGVGDEFAVGVPGDPVNGGGAVYVFRGTNELARLINTGDSTDDAFGAALAFVPDTDGNARDELVIGVPHEDSPSGASQIGKAVLMEAFCPPPVAYCTAKTNSLGCVPSIDWVGDPDITGPFAFVPMAHQVLNQKSGLFVWSRERQEVPFQGGTLCVASPLFRSPPLFSDGNTTGSDCSGTLIYSITPMLMWLHGWEVGDQLFGQFWYRDPQHPDGTGVGLSNALSFRVCW